MEYFIFLVVTGLATGFVYSLLSLGFVVIYKSTRVLNFAQSGLVVLGAYFCFATLAQIKMHPVIALLLALTMSAIVAILIERILLRPLIGRSILSLVMVTIGLTSIIEGIIITIWGADVESLPQVLPDISFSLGGSFIPSPYVWGIIVSSTLITALLLFFKFTSLGIVMRAVSNNQPGALSMGISVSRIFAFSWIFASLIATAGGYILCSITVLNTSAMILVYPLFAAVILGGLDSILGALIGGIVIGVLQSIVVGYMGHLTGSGFKIVVPFIFLLVFLIFKPYGLFGTKEVERL